MKGQYVKKSAKSKQTANDHKPSCPCCHHRGFVLLPKNEWQIKPEFKCQHCGTVWSWGRDGGPYLAAAQNVKGSK